MTVNVDKRIVGDNGTIRSTTRAERGDAADYKDQQAWFSDIGAMGYSDGVEWNSNYQNFGKLQIINYLNPVPRLANGSEPSITWAAVTGGGGWATPLTSGGGTYTRTTVDDTSDTSTLDIPLGGRAFENITFNGVLGRKYVFTVDVVVNSGSTTAGIYWTGQGFTLNKIPITTSGRYALAFTNTVPGSTIRVGSGMNGGAAAGEVCNITVTNPMVHDVTDTGDLFYDYVERHTPADNYPGNTIDPTTKKVVQALGREYEYTSRALNLLFFTGDSFVKETYGYAMQIALTTDYCAYVKHYASLKLSVEIAAAYTTNIAEYPYEAAILQGGVNDLDADVSLATMKAALVGMCDINDTAEIVTFIVNIAPNAFLQARPTIAARLLDWNLWLKKFCNTRGYVYIDQYALFRDTNLDRMKPEYVVGTYTGDYTYTGDVVHPNEAGHAALKDLVKNKLDQFQRPPKLNGRAISN